MVICLFAWWDQRIYCSHSSEPSILFDNNSFVYSSTLKTSTTIRPFNRKSKPPQNLWENTIFVCCWLSLCLILPIHKYASKLSSRNWWRLFTFCDFYTIELILKTKFLIYTLDMRGWNRPEHLKSNDLHQFWA